MKTRSFLAATVMCGALLAGGSLPAHLAVAETPTAASAPTVLPDRVTLNAMQDGSNGQVVTWRSAASVTAPQVQWSPDTSNPWGFTTKTAAATTQTLTSDLGYTHAFHTASITGLKPGTTYLYRVGGGGSWSAWMPFTTSDAAAKKTSLLAMGDIQTGIRDHWTRVANAAYRDRPDARALITVGDQVNTFNNDAQWDELFDAAGQVPSTMQWLPAVGNHEYRSTDSGELTPQYRAQFETPTNGPTDFPHFGETVYYADVDNVRVVTLNSYYRIPLDKADEQRWLNAQAAWLEGVLKNNPRHFTIVNMHYPVYSSSPDRANPELRATMEPIFEKYGVDLVLQGHDHAYVSGQRDATKDPRRGATATGPIYVTSSSSNRQYPVDYSDWTKNGATPVTAYGSRSTYQLIDVEGRTLTYTAKDSTGQVMDQWSIEKRTGGFKVVKNVASAGVPR